jgi:hypothetical protein
MTKVLNGKNFPDCVAEDAVPCELFSRLNSLLIGKNTGKFLLLPTTI